MHACVSVKGVDSSFVMRLCARRPGRGASEPHWYMPTPSTTFRPPPSAGAVRSEGWFRFNLLGPPSFPMWVGCLDQPVHPRTRSQGDCAQLICGALRSFDAPRTQLHSYLSKSPRAPPLALEEPQGV